MKLLVVLLLVANIVAAAWLVQQRPSDTIREPGRMSAQLAADKFRLLSNADLAHLQAKAAQEAKDQAAAAAAAQAAAATAAPAQPAAPAPASTPPPDKHQ